MSDGRGENANSTQPGQTPIEKHLKNGLKQALGMLRELCTNSGSSEQAALEVRHFTVQRWAMPGGATALFAQSPQVENAPTLLIYNHYCRPVSKKSGMFKRDERLIGPGTVAGGTFAARLLALDSWIAENGTLPINIKWLVEGEGGEGKVNPELENLLKEHAAELKANACLWSTGSFTPDGRAQINLGTKGILTVELRSRTLSQPADSALAGVLPNAAWRIAWALNAIKGDTEEIRISGFGDENDSDLSIPGDDLSLLLGSVRDHKPRLSERLKSLGLENYLMELRDPQVLLTEFFTPTANISGFQAGLNNSGSATSLPATASARLDFRLVPNHHPTKVLELLKAHLEYKDLGDVEVEPIGIPLKPARTSPAHPFAKLVIECVSAASELSPLIIPLSPGAEPMAFFKDALGDMPIVGLGVGHDGMQQGQKQENIRLSDFAAHARTVARLLGQMVTLEQAPIQEPTIESEFEPLEAFSFGEN